MSDFRQQFLNRAFQVVPGPEFNRARRELPERGEVVPVIYGGVQPARGAREEFLERTLPLMVRDLRAQGADPENPRLLVVALFYRDGGDLLEDRAFLDGVCELEGLNAQALHFRVLRWLSEPLPTNVPP